MSLSLGSVLMCILIIFALYIYFELILYGSSKFFVREIRVIFVGVILLCVRALLPVNFSFTVTIPIKYGLTEITAFMFDTEIRGLSLFDGFLCVWILGFFIKIMNLIRKCRKSRSMLQQAASIEHFRKKQVLDVLEKYDMDNIKIAILPKFVSPGISGIFKPILVMPDYDFSDEDLHYIISHEVTHYKKFDLIIKLFLEICTCIYWWNPVMYLFKAKFTLAIEIANDISVIKGQSDTYQLNYIKCLLLNSRLHSCKNSSRYEDIFQIPFIKSNSDLKIRVKKILSYQEEGSFRIFGLLSKCLLLVMLFIGIVIVPEAYFEDPEIENTTFSVNSDNSYLVETSKGFDLYADDKYVATFSEIGEVLRSLGLRVYKEKK